MRQSRNSRRIAHIDAIVTSTSALSGAIMNLPIRNERVAPDLVSALQSLFFKNSMPFGIPEISVTTKKSVSSLTELPLALGVFLVAMATDNLA